MNLNSKSIIDINICNDTKITDDLIYCEGTWLAS